MKRYNDKWALVLVLALLPACLERAKGDDSGDGTDAPAEEDTNAPALQLSSNALRFPGAPLGEVATQTLTLTNVGDADLQLIDVAYEGPSTFEVQSLTTPRLAPGESTALSVTFTPATTAEQRGSLRIASSDPLQPEASVALVGEGLGGLLEGPAELLFGPTALGCVDTGTAVFSNGGNVPLTLSGASVSAPFSINEAVLPVTIDPGDTARLNVWFAPTHPDQPTSALLVVHADTGDFTVPLTGSLADITVTTESFVANGRATDVLLSVDTSPSMAMYIPSIVSAMPDLMGALDDQGADWRVSVVSRDNGCILGSDLFIDATFSPTDAQAAVSTMIGMTGGYGTNQERAFMLMESSIDETSPGGCNEGMLRDSATLQLVAVSDEGDRSTQATLDYVRTFQGIKDDPADVAMHAIGPCVAGTDTQRYEDAAGATGGQVYSICEPLDANFDAMARTFALSGAPVYPLAAPAVFETITVQVDGVSRTDWRYDAATQTVAFEAATAPLSGEAVEITYVADACP